MSERSEREPRKVVPYSLSVSSEIEGVHLGNGEAIGGQPITVFRQRYLSYFKI
jgi:hypothetical protein